jgi:hypothetical protein
MKKGNLVFISLKTKSPGCSECPKIGINEIERIDGELIFLKHAQCYVTETDPLFNILLLTKISARFYGKILNKANFRTSFKKKT